MAINTTLVDHPVVADALTRIRDRDTPNALFRQGWRPDSLKVGDKVQVSGVRAKKAESNRIGQAQITMPDGRVFARGTASNQQ